MYPLGKLCIIDDDLNKEENCVYLKKIKYSQILLNLFTIKEGSKVVYIPFKHNDIRLIWAQDV